MKQQINDLRKSFKLVYFGTIEGDNITFDICLIYRTSINNVTLEVFYLNNEVVNYECNINTLIAFEQL